MVTQQRLREVLRYDPETGEFTWLQAGKGRRVGAVAGSSKGTESYWQINFDRYNYLAHRLAWLYMTGEWPAEVDHRNRVKSDNRWANLRLASHKQNCENVGMRKHNTSGARGVYLQKNGRWQAYITSNKTRFHLGRFDDFEAAVAARRLAEEKHFTHAHGTEQIS